jgi:hypothetical protein
VVGWRDILRELTGKITTEVRFPCDNHQPTSTTGRGRAIAACFPHLRAECGLEEARYGTEIKATFRSQGLSG